MTKDFVGVFKSH